MNKLVLADLEQVEQTLQEQILVLVCDSIDRIGHVPSVMLDDEVALSWREVGIGHGIDALHESTVASRRVCMRRLGGILHGRENSRGANLLDQVANDFVVEILDGRPLD